MGLRLIARKAVKTNLINSLGLNTEIYSIDSKEVMANALRRSASVLCPCTDSNLIRSVINPMKGLIDNIDEYRNQIESVLESLIAYGDILEHHGFEEGEAYRSKPQLYAAPPSFVVRKSGLAIIIGVSEDLMTLLTDDLYQRLEIHNHVRRIQPKREEDLKSVLLGQELIQISYSRWIKSPRIKDSIQLLDDLNNRLDIAELSFDIPGLVILDTLKPVNYYRGRWVTPHRESGRFIARREQAYGAPIWCYVELSGGQPQKLVDLPLKPGMWRGCDEAWHYQLSIDAISGTPQLFELEPNSDSTHLLKLFSPLPSWVTRRWDIVGDPIDIPKCLFAYEINNSELAEEVTFLQDDLHLQMAK